MIISANSWADIPSTPTRACAPGLILPLFIFQPVLTRIELVDVAAPQLGSLSRLKMKAIYTNLLL